MRRVHGHVAHEQRLFSAKKNRKTCSNPIQGARTNLAHLAERLRIGSLLLAHTHDHVHKSTVVLQPLLGTAGLLLLLLLLGDLGGLAANLARTSERTVDLALRSEGTGRRQGQTEDRGR